MKHSVLGILSAIKTIVTHNVHTTMVMSSKYVEQKTLKSVVFRRLMETLANDSVIRAQRFSPCLANCISVSLYQCTAVSVYYCLMRSDSITCSFVIICITKISH